MRIVAPSSAFHGFRYSESALPDSSDSSFQLPSNNAKNRSSLAALATPRAINCNNLFIRYDSSTSETSGFDGLNLWSVEVDVVDAASPSHSLTHPTEFEPSYQGVSIEVNNHSVNNQGVVMYHVDIKGPDGFLSTYTIRRRFRAFKNLYTELNRLVIEYQQNHRAHLKAVETAKKKKAAASSLDSLRDNHIPLSPHSALTARAKGPPVSNTNYSIVTFPSLPSAGVWSMLKRHDVRLVEKRKQRFQEILALAIRHPATRNSSVLDEFLSVAPSEISQRGSSYVSLQDYSVPVYDRKRESIERRQRKMQLLEVRRLRAGSDSQFGERAPQ
uniref:PX domain-containing protein n=1 Tax=Hyaloperonospora arabidopsidis (strain Emoy2) TaxID=559515 RepID=M4BE46_HYAAE